MKQEKFFRLLPIEGAYNIRDLGGYPTSDHKHAKWKTFIRSGDLDKLTESDLDYLTSLHYPNRHRLQEHAGKKKTAADKIPSTVTQYIPLSIEAGDMTDMTHFNLNNIPGILEQAYVYIIQNAQGYLSGILPDCFGRTEYSLFISLLSGKRPYRNCRSLTTGSIGCRQGSDNGRLHAVCRIYKKGNMMQSYKLIRDLPLSPQYGKNIWKLLSKPLTLTIKVWITT